MLANQLKSAAVADLLHVRKTQQKERAHRFVKNKLLQKMLLSTTEASLLLPFVVNVVIHVFSNPRFILDQLLLEPFFWYPGPWLQEHFLSQGAASVLLLTSGGQDSVQNSQGRPVAKPRRQATLVGHLLLKELVCLRVMLCNHGIVKRHPLLDGVFWHAKSNQEVRKVEALLSIYPLRGQSVPKLLQPRPFGCFSSSNLLWSPARQSLPVPTVGTHLEELDQGLRLVP